MARRLFGTGFSKTRPSAEEIARIGSDLAIARGIRDGISQKIRMDLDARLAGARQVADSLAEKIDSAISDPIADAKILAQAATAKLLGSIKMQLLPAVELALRLGMDAMDLPSVAAHAKPRPRKRRRGAPPQSDAQPGPFEQPPGPDDPPPGDPPQQQMFGPPGGVFPPGQFGQQAPVMPAPPPASSIPAPPNLSSVPPEYMVLIQRGTCRVVAIPGYPGEEYLGAGYVPITQAGNLQSVPQAQVQGVWQQIVNAVGGCATPPLPGAPGSGAMAGPPGGQFPSGQFPSPAPIRGGAVNVEPGQIAAPVPGAPEPAALGSVPSAATSPAPITGTAGYGPQLVQGTTETGQVRFYRVPITTTAPVAQPLPQPQQNFIMGAYPPAPIAQQPPFLPAPASPPGMIGPPAPAPAGPPQGPIQWVPGPGGSLLPIFPSQPSLPTQAHPQYPYGGAPYVLGGSPLPPYGLVSPYTPPAPPPGMIFPFGQPGAPGAIPGPFPAPPSAPGPIGAGLPSQPGSFPLPGPGVPVVPSPVVGLPPSPVGPPPLTATLPPPAPIDLGPILPLPGAPVPLPPLPVAAPPPAAPPPCPAPTITVNCPACNCPVAVPEIPEFQPVSPPAPPVEPTAFRVPGRTNIEPGFIAAGPIAEGTPPAECIPNSAIIQAIAGKDLRSILIQIGWLTEDGQFTFTRRDLDTLGNASDLWSNVRRFLVLALDNLAGGTATALNAIQQGISKAAGCPPTRPDGSNPDVSTAALAQVIIGFVRHWICDLPEGMTRSWDYYSNWACPDRLPTSDWANEAYAKHIINFDDWKCLIRANGDIERYQSFDVSMRQEVLTADDALSLYRRKILDEATFNAIMRRNGWYSIQTIDWYKQAHEWVATPSDAINWMLKDIDDPQIQNTFQLGREFALKYQGQTKAAMDANGLSAQNAENLWRAHWRNMSPTQLYEMHKRLRPGWTNLMSGPDAIALATAILPRRPVGPGAAQEMQQNPRTWLEDITELPEELQGEASKVYLESLQTTGFHLFEALGQADYPPFWRDRLMSISYNVLTRVDMRRAFETNQMSSEVLVARLQDRGYTPNDSSMLAGFYREAAVQLAARRPAANSWVTVGYDERLLRQTLIDNGMRPDMWEDVFRRLQVRRKIYIQTKCLAVWKREFVAKLYTETEMHVRLTNLGMTTPQAEQLIQDWTCERRATHRQVMAAALCKQRRQGIINDVALVSGLRDLGYRPRDIRRMQASCLAATPRPTVAVKPTAGEPVVLPEEGLR